jgi:hypothetical protein
MFDLQILFGGLALFLVTLAGILCLGVFLRSALRLKCSEPLIANAVLGVVGLMLVALMAATLRLYRWPVLIIITLVPVGMAPFMARRWERPRWAIGKQGSGPISWLTGLVTMIAIVQASAPVVHFDLLVNYLGVARADLLQGHVGALPHNIHSALSLPLHVLGAFVLALGEPLNRTPFPFGMAPLWSLVIGFSLVASVALTVRLAQSTFPDDADGARWSGWAGAALWLVTPQTLLLAQLQSAEIVLTTLVLALAVTAVTAARSEVAGDVVIVGLLGGLVVACKPHLAVLVLVAWLLAIRGRPAFQIVASVAAALLVPCVAMARSGIVFGHPLFPWMGPADPAAAALMAENSVTLALNPLEIVHRFFLLVTLQPESGALFAVVFLGLLGRRRSTGLWVMGGLQLLALVMVTANTVNTLRWAQPVLPILALVSVEGLRTRFAGEIQRRLFRWGILGVAVGCLGLALSFSQRLTGLAPQFGLTTEEYLDRTIPRFEARLELATLETRTLVLGEIIGFYTGPGDVIPAPQNGHWAQRALDESQRFDHLWIAPEGLNDLRRQHTWEWLDEGGLNELRHRVQVENDSRRLPGVILLPINQGSQ